MKRQCNTFLYVCFAARFLGQVSDKLIAFAGHYCVLNASSSTPTDDVTGNACRLGEYCLEGSSEGIECPSGKGLTRKNKFETRLYSDVIVTSVR